MRHISKVLGDYPKSTGLRKSTSEGKVVDQAIGQETDYSSNPDCAVCGGAGFLHPRLPDGKPDYSQVISCQAEGCLADQEKAFKATEPYIKSKGVTKFNTFDTFKPVLGAETTLEAFKDIAFSPDAPPLLLVYGTPGNGKTFLCEATISELVKRGIDCRLWAVADLVSKLKESIAENATELLMRKLKELPALILDEWGQNYGSDWEVQKLEEIVIAREREGLITIITTNLELDKLPERIISRFGDATQARLILNKAPDYRPTKKAKRKR